MNDRLSSNLTLEWTATATVGAMSVAVCLLLLREDLDADAAASRASDAATQSALAVVVRKSGIMIFLNNCVSKRTKIISNDVL